jgi:hypothetical protein
MVAPLPAPEVLRWYQHDAFEPQLPVMCLRWQVNGQAQDERLWGLPEGVAIQGPPPQLFGLRVLRPQTNAYSVRLVWNRTALAWEALSRAQLLESCLQPLLAVLGIDLWQLLDQPARVAYPPRDSAA